MHTIHRLCRICIEQNLPQVCFLIQVLRYRLIVPETPAESGKVFLELGRVQQNPGHTEQESRPLWPG